MAGLRDTLSATKLVHAGMAMDEAKLCSPDSIACPKLVAIMSGHVSAAQKNTLCKSILMCSSEQATCS